MEMDIHDKFKHWLTEQKYAQYNLWWHSPDSWMIYSVKAKKFRGTLKQSWGDVLKNKTK